MSKLEGWGTEHDAEVIRDDPHFKGWEVTTWKKFKNGRVHYVLTSPDNLKQWILAEMVE